MESSAWCLEENVFDPAVSRAWEGVMTLGSGYLHTRATPEEHLSGAAQNVDRLRMPGNVTAEKFEETPAKWGTFVPGVFGPHPTLNDEMVNLPWFLQLAPSVDGEKLDMQHSEVSDYQRVLNMKEAVLYRSFRWHTASGAAVDVQFERFISAEHPGLSVQRLTLKADRDVAANIDAGIDADVRTSGYDHIEETGFSHVEGDGIRCRVLTNGSDEVTMQTRLSGPLTWTYTEADRTAALTATLMLTPGQPVCIEKRTAVTTSRDQQKQDAGQLLDGLADRSFEDLKNEHVRLWAARWDRSDIVVEGDESVQRAMRVSIYHLLRCQVTGDSRVAIDAKGYAGDAYFGRYFWDTEVYLLPFYLYTQPERARDLCDFRLRTLKGARDNARRYGYRGARYAWESDSLGRECCACWQYADHEVHITADVVYALAHYARAAEPDYLRNDAAEAIVEAARYWLDRIDQRAGDDYPSILGVMGPDEYTPMSNNNAYTNCQVAFTLRTAEEVGDAGGASREERERFRSVAASLPVFRNGDLILQCEDFDSYAEPQFERYWHDRSEVFASQVSQERLYRTKCLKQADVIMLMVLFPHAFTEAECVAAWDYYLPYTTHDSSLSAGVHAILAARLGREEQAWAFFRQGLYKDIDVEHGGASEGIHIAGCGCNWQVAVLGFAGFDTALQSDSLSLRPHLPQQLDKMFIPLVWQGVPVRVHIDREQCTVVNEGTDRLDVCVWDTLRAVEPGETESFPL